MEILSAMSEIHAVWKAFNYFIEGKYFKYALEMVTIPLSDEVTQLKMAELMRKCGIFVTREQLNKVLKQIFTLPNIYSNMKHMVDQIWTFTLEDPRGFISLQQGFSLLKLRRLPTPHHYLSLSLAHRKVLNL